MKYLFLIVFTLCAMALSMPDTAFAYNNEIGFYADLDYSTPFVVPDPDYPIFEVYVVIHNPYNEVFDMPVENLYGFEFTINSPNSVFIMSSIYPVGAIDFGMLSDEYIIGFTEPLPVTPETPTLILTLTLLEISLEDDHYLYLTPVSTPSIPDEIAFFDFSNNDSIIPMNNVIGGELSNPIFGINPTEPVVAVDHISFDAVKALYR